MRSAALVVVLLLAGCSRAPAPDAEPAPPTPTSRSSPTSPPSTPAAEPRMSPEEAAHDPRALLLGARVTRTAAGLGVEAWWGCWEAGCRRNQVIVTVRPDGTTSYERGSQRTWLADVRPDRPTVPPALEGLLVNTVPSLEDGILARVGGGDGATLFPFEKAARSTDGGATWTAYDVPEIGGERAYISGGVVLPDGRHLTLIGSWSGDRRHRPGPQHHGLWVSDGDDWSSYRPVEPVFEPALTTAPGRVMSEWSSLDHLQASPAGGGVIWTTSWDDRLYASVDGAETFAEIAAR